MKKLNVYIAKQIFVGFLLVTFSLLSILWLTQSLRFVELITNKGLPLSLFIEMTSLLMPRLYIILSPIALFVAVLFVYNRMLSDRELVVMKSAGISPWQNAKPALFMGIALPSSDCMSTISASRRPKRLLTNWSGKSKMTFRI